MYSNLSRILEKYRQGFTVITNDNPDMNNMQLYRAILDPMWINTVKTLAYSDVIDVAIDVEQERAANWQKNADMRIAALDQRLTSVMGEVASLRTSIDTLIAFFGVTIPAWSNKDEVENGDDMGMVRPSAAELGILVAFEFVRQQLGFGHEDVVSIDPPAGTLIARGNTVKVTLNLLG